MILKAGTYRFNDVPNALYNITTQEEFDTFFPIAQFSFNFVSNGINYTKIESMYANGTFAYSGLSFTATEFSSLSYSDDEGTISTQAYGKGTGFDGVTYSGWQNEAYKEHTIPEQEVDDTFGTWYIANTNYNEVNPTPLATIEYNGQTIAQLNAGETATLSCEGKKMASDVVVKVNEPKCTLPHIIEVDELPTSNIDTNAVYKIRPPYQNGVIRAGTYEFKDVINPSETTLYQPIQFKSYLNYETPLDYYGMTVESTGIHYWDNADGSESESVYSFIEGWGSIKSRTNRIPTDNEASETFGTWFNANIQGYDVLYQYVNGEWVQYKTDDTNSIVGTWVFEELPILPNKYFGLYGEFKCKGNIYHMLKFTSNYIELEHDNGTPLTQIYTTSNGWAGEDVKQLKVNSLHGGDYGDAENAEPLSFYEKMLRINATKQ